MKNFNLIIFIVEVLKLLRVINSSLGEQGYPHKLIKVFKVYTKENKTIKTFSLVSKKIYIARSLAKNKYSNCKIYIYSEYVNPYFLYETKDKSGLYYIGPKINSSLYETYNL